MIVEYLISQRSGRNHATCCGEFRDWTHFAAFKRVEASYGRFVASERELRDVIGITPPESASHGAEPTDQ